MDLALQEQILAQWEQETFTEEEIIDLTAFLKSDYLLKRNSE